MSNLSSRVLACCLRSRNAYEQLSVLVEFGELGPQYRYLLSLVTEFYEADKQAGSVDTPTLMERIAQRQSKASQTELLSSLVEECSGVDISTINFVDLQQEAAEIKLRDQLLTALTDDTKKEARTNLLEKYLSVHTVSEKFPLREGEDTEEIYHNVSIEDSIQGALNLENRIYLAPSPLHEMTGGCSLGDHILIFARPESGKTAAAVTMSVGFSMFSNLDGIYFGNEDNITKIVARAQLCMTGMTAEQIKEDPSKAAALLEKRGWGRMRFIPLTPGTPAEIEKYIRRYHAKWAVVDQIRNLAVRADTRTNQLETIATEMRNIGNRNKCIMVSITQAGDSADEKLKLGMGDIDSSNTGIPAQVDLMVGIGVNVAYELEGHRMINLPKNKLSGRHGSKAVKLNQDISRLEAL